MVLTITLGTLALLSLALTLWQWAVAFRFPLHQLSPDTGTAEDIFVSPVTLLKPLKGLDAETVDCLRSWLRQQYPGEVQVLFGVASASDPVCDAVRQLITSHPKKNVQLVICPENLGANAKVSTLIQLMRLARHEVMLVSDADVWVPEGFVAQIAPLFKDPALGLLNCFYYLKARVEKSPDEARTTATSRTADEPPTRGFLRLSQLAMCWEAFAINADFWSQVLQRQSLKPLDFALGAVMATTRGQLAKIGNFDCLADYLADDYQLGHRIARNGARISLSTLVVECRHSPMIWRAVWSHQIRWARTIRACQPLPYFASQLHNATLWPVLWALWNPTPLVLAIVICCLLTRMATGFYCARKLTRRLDFHSLWMAPVKDLLQTIIWATAFLGSEIKWADHQFRIQAGGKLSRSVGADVRRL